MIKERDEMIKERDEMITKLTEDLERMLTITGAAHPEEPKNGHPPPPKKGTWLKQAGSTAALAAIPMLVKMVMGQQHQRAVNLVAA
jgi:hypothetical protein